MPSHERRVFTCKHGDLGISRGKTYNHFLNNLKARYCPQMGHMLVKVLQHGRMRPGVINILFPHSTELKIRALVSHQLVKIKLTNSPLGVECSLRTYT